MELLNQIIGIIVPKEYLEHFEAKGCKEFPDRWEIELREKDNILPESLKGQEAVRDGYCNPIEIMSHCFSLKPVRLKIFRRRWKLPNENGHFSTEYTLHPKGAKITKELASFLKGEN